MSEALIAKIKSGKFSRLELLQMRQNAKLKARKGDTTAEEIIAAIDTTAVPKLVARVN